MTLLDTSNQDYEFYKRVGGYYSKFFLFFNKIEYYGLENIIRGRSGIIAPNHVGSAKDIFSLFEILNQLGIPLSFAARHELFDKDKTFGMAKSHLKKHIKVLESLVPDWRIEEFAEFCASVMEKMGAIKCAVDRKMDRAEMIKINTEARTKMEYDVSQLERKIVVFQYQDKKSRVDKHAVFHGAKKGAAIVAYNVYEHHRVVVPVYPAAILGSKGLMPWYMVTELRRKPIKVSIGQPLEITSFINEKNPVESMRAELESRIWYLLGDLARREDKGQILYPSKDFRLRDFLSALLVKGEKRNLIYPEQRQSQSQPSPYKFSSQNK